VIDARGRVLATNLSLERLDRQIVAGAFGRIAFANPSANVLLSEAVSQLHCPRRPVRSIMVPGTVQHPSLVAHVVPDAVPMRFLPRGKVFSS